HWVWPASLPVQPSSTDPGTAATRCVPPSPRPGHAAGKVSSRRRTAHQRSPSALASAEVGAASLPPATNRLLRANHRQLYGGNDFPLGERDGDGSASGDAATGLAHCGEDPLR